MPQQVIDQNQDQNNQNQNDQNNQNVNNQQIDWETDDNPYKKRYQDSERQAPALVNVLKQNGFEYDHNTKAWKKAQVQQQGQEEDVEKLLEGYDPDFKKSLKVYTQKQIDTAIRNFSEQSSFMSNYNSGVTSARARVIEEFGNEFELAKEGKFNVNSPLYKLANDILMKDYSEYNTDGTFKKYSRADAEYKAVAEAYAIIQRKSKIDPNFGKTKLGAIQGKGSSSSSVKGKLSWEEYEKLTEEQKDAYDGANFKG